MQELWIPLLLTAIPLYVANASAVVFGGKTPVDFNRTWGDGKPILGKGKTWKGFGMGVLIGTFTGGIILHYFPTQALATSPEYLLFSFLLSAGALVGDMAGSFIKRRMGMQRGQAAHFLDQLDFVVGGLVLSLLAGPPYWVTVFLVLIMITPFLHMAFNRLAYLLGLKSVPW
ncbi:MAG: CDP-2,3-bis-(O-geranylgeranyl)-sn-glycerol synthase [archaeon]